jgi:hypothetical protein
MGLSLLGRASSKHGMDENEKRSRKNLTGIKMDGGGGGGGTRGSGGGGMGKALARSLGAAVCLAGIVATWYRPIIQHH